MCYTLNQLDYLGLNRNHIRCEGGRSLIPCLEFIDKLDICDCGISDAVEEEIEHERRRLSVSVCVIIYTACMSGYQLTVVVSIVHA